MSEREGPGRGVKALVGAWVALAAIAGTLALRNLERPGLYYDEVIQALPAAEFLRDDGRPLAIPGARSVRTPGGWFPLMTQPYMGALKSQLLIPVFAGFGARPGVLRTTTWLWGLLGVALLMLWARRVFGAEVALLAGALSVLDPSLLFVTRHDWGSFSLALVCRGAGLLLATEGLQRGSRGRCFAGGLALGLGIYNKIDFAATLPALAVALLVAAPAQLRWALRERRGGTAAGLVGLTVGASPMLLAASAALRSAGAAALAGQRAGAAEWSEKLTTWWTLLDGSHFHRLMLAGGNFEALADVEGAAASPFPMALLLATGVVAVRVWRGARAGRPEPALGFALAATLLSTGALLLVPRAVRIHHALGVHPFPQLLVACAAVSLWRGEPATRRARLATRSAAAGLLVVVLAGQLRVDLHTLEAIGSSGGKGRWSSSLVRLADELRASPGAVVVSLDWGFHAQLRFLAPELELHELVWNAARAAAAGRPWSLEGTPRHVYLVQAPGFQVFPTSAALLEAALPLPEARVEARRDAEGDVAFYAIRFARPHRLVYRGAFEVRLR